MIEFKNCYNCAHDYGFYPGCFECYNGEYYTPRSTIARNLYELTVGISSNKPKSIPEIKNVIFNPPATIVFWSDGTKTVVKCYEEDYFSKECGLAMAICKKAYGNDNTFHKIFKKYAKPVDFPYKFYTGAVFNKAYRKFMESIYGIADN